MQLYFIRHGESSNNALFARNGNSIGRSEDPELTETGKEQALRVAQFFTRSETYAISSLGEWVVRRHGLEGLRQPYPLTHLYTSLMVRAADTAAPIAAALELPLQGWVDLHEGGGIYLDLPVESGPEGDARSEPVGQPGKSRSELQSRYPQISLPEAVGEQGWWNRPFENDAERPGRARRVLEAIIQKHGALHPDGSEDRVGIVSHGNFYNYFIRAVMGLPPPNRVGELSNLWFEINNTAVTRIDYQPPYFNVIYMNRTDFLPPKLVT